MANRTHVALFQPQPVIEACSVDLSLPSDHNSNDSSHCQIVSYNVAGIVCYRRLVSCRMAHAEESPQCRALRSCCCFWCKSHAMTTSSWSRSGGGPLEGPAVPQHNLKPPTRARLSTPHGSHVFVFFLLFVEAIRDFHFTIIVLVLRKLREIQTYKSRVLPIELSIDCIWAYQINLGYYFMVRKCR